MTPLTDPPRSAAKGWQRYAVMILSSGLMAWCMPTETASYVMQKEQVSEMRRKRADDMSERTHLTDGKVAETTDHFLRVIVSVLCEKESKREARRRSSG